MVFATGVGDGGLNGDGIYCCGSMFSRGLVLGGKTKQVTSCVTKHMSRLREVSAFGYLPAVQTRCYQSR